VANGKFKIIVCGESFGEQPKEFEDFREKFEKQGLIEHWGFAKSKTDYHALLSKSHIAVSTAIHEFFGVAIVEAVSVK